MACDFYQLPHAGIQALTPYVPGKSAEQVAKEYGITDIIKLASNENPFGCSPLVHEALASLSGHQIATYPVSSIQPLRKKIALQLGIDSERITLGNGSDELIPLLQICFALHSGHHIVTHQHAFISYEIHAKTLGIPVVSTPLLPNWEVDIDALLSTCNDKTAMIFLANPNNPTGLLISQETIKYLLHNLPETTLVVVDEAYYEYVQHRDPSSMFSLLQRYPNLIITRTFSKAYGLAGLRLGYVVSCASIAKLLQRVQPPFAVNEAALTAASAALDDPDFVRSSVENNARGLKQMQHGLTALTIEHLPSSGNFITFDCKHDTTALYEGLQKKGIIVRPLHAYGLNRHLRVTIGTQEQNHRFLNNLEELIS